MNGILDRDLCISTHRDCADSNPQFRSIEEARLIEIEHAAHGSCCYQHLAAVAYSCGVQAQDDWDE